MDRHILRSGEALDLAQLAPAQRQHLALAWAAYERGQAMPAFMAEWMHKDTPLFFEGGAGPRLAGQEVVRSTLYRVLQDLSLRLGVAQGLLREDEASALPQAPHGRAAGLPS